MLSTLFFGVILGGIFAGAYAWFRRAQYQKLLEGLQVRLILVRLPLGGKEGRDLMKEIALTEQLIAALAAFKKPFVFEVAVPYVGEEIHFYISVSEQYVDAAVRQVQSMWDDADIRKVEDYNIFNYQGYTTGAWLKEKEKFVLPIRTYQELMSDTFSSILGGFAQTKEVGEGAALQIVVQSASAKAKKEIVASLGFLKKGGKLKEVLHAEKIGASDVVSAALAGKKSGNVPGPQESKVIDEMAVKAIETKLAKPLFDVNVRILTSAPSQLQAESLLDGISAGFSQFGTTGRNEFQMTKPRAIKNLVRAFSFRAFDEKQKMTLTSEELASIFHFPTVFTSTPKIKYLKAKEAAPPRNLPTFGTLLGESSFRGESKPIFLTDEDRRRHLYVIGQTGTGKTTLLKGMMLDDIRKGKGIGVIDPHGEFAEFALANIPPERAKDVIVFDPADFERPVGLNMLEYHFDRPEEKTFIVNDMLGILDKLYDLRQTGGPMFEQYMRNALLLLMEDAPNQPASLVELPRIFTDSAWRAKKLARITNPIVIDFWEKEATKAGGEASLANITPYVTSKFSNFIANDYMRPIIGQPKSAFNFREIMDQGKILIVSLSKGKIGDVNMGLLGMIVISKLLFAALSRVDIPNESSRKDFYLYIDEFQNFATDSISVILSEARKYRLSLTIAHQFIAQLPEKIRDAVFGNVGSAIALRVGPQDAEFLTKQFTPVFNESDLLNIDNLNAHARILVDGMVAPPFNIRVNTAAFSAKGDVQMAERLRNLSRLTYGRDRGEVEEEIRRRLRE
ncbi:MAG: DUF87 domain-containing protein [Patescibacteria group bacterium]